MLIGNSKYNNLSQLDCCDKDVSAIDQLLKATENYSKIFVIRNSESVKLKNKIREIVSNYSEIDEFFFYFTGHGFYHNSEFFYCATDFDTKQPNQTGLSNSELHNLLKQTKADLVVKVIDACNSGTLLVKSDEVFLPNQKNEFNHLIQIASCLNTQNSLTGDPLSLFTEKFRDAALSKHEGGIYYSDIIDILRDEFLNDNIQTPHFVIQSTGREKFLDNAARLSSLRDSLLQKIEPTDEDGNIEVEEHYSNSKFLEKLNAIEGPPIKKELVDNHIGSFFKKIIEGIKTVKFLNDFYDVNLIIHPEYNEETTRNFICSILSSEHREDDFVVAEVKNKYRGSLFNLNLMSRAMGEPIEYRFELNCDIREAQLRITLKPKFVNLKQFVLVVSCAPSIKNLYIFEVLTLHSLNNWDSFNENGEKINQQWYKTDWYDELDDIVNAICDVLLSSVNDYHKDIDQNL